MDYGLRREIDKPWDEALEATREALATEGFGVLSEIDMKEKLSEKLDVEIDGYVILGACNPSLAYKALQSEQEIGLLLPCNVIVYEKDGRTVVSAVDPDSMLSIVGDNSTVEEVAKDARERLTRALDRLES